MCDVCIIIIIIKNVKVANTLITERTVPELIPVLGSQPAGDVSYKPGGRLSLLSARPQLPPQPLRGLLPILLLGEQRHNGCEQFAQDCYPTALWLRFEPGPFCAWVQHANHSATEPPNYLRVTSCLLAMYTYIVYAVPDVSPCICIHETSRHVASLRAGVTGTLAWR